MMEKKSYTVSIDQVRKKFPEGTEIGELIKDFLGIEAEDVLLVIRNGKLCELSKTLTCDCEIRTVCRTDEIGFDTYKRSINFLFLKAVSDLTRKNKEVQVTLQFSIRNGYYYTISGPVCIDDKFVDEIREQMHSLVKRHLPIEKHRMSTGKAREMFRSCGMEDKEQLLRFRRASSVNIYSLEDYRDYFFGYMVRHTGYLQYFDLCRYEKGIILILPEKRDPILVKPFQSSPKLFSIQEESEKWGERLQIKTVCDLNNCISSGELEHQLLVAEALQEGRISDIAGEIQSRGNIKAVLIAGPSSSGKTTFSRRLSIQLAAHGMRPHPVSLDNYYKNRADCPRDENGKYDFESLDALDLALLKKDLTALVSGEKVRIPHFNFITGEREYQGESLSLKEEDILVLEGIHGLNDRLSDFLPPECKYRIYISALTQLNIDGHNPISTTDGRLIRRIIRDYRARGTSARQSIAMWPGVRRGEDKNIFPYQENADVIFNSALIYELAVLKNYAEPLLFQIQEDDPEYFEAKRLLKFLDYFLGFPSEDIPNNSILREFIGGSCFDV